jgi:mannose-6-phosphate isomerase-like protein (cupin superfamily)
MRKKILKRTAMILLIIIPAYIIIGNMLHRIVFPEKIPAISSHFSAGQQFYSKAEKFRQTVVKQENGFVHVTSSMEPFAPGPPKHVHENLDETFEIANGELTIWVNGEIKKLHAGEKLFVPKGTPHQPYNETADTIYSKGTFAFPEKFAFHLEQIYGYMDKNPDFAKSPKTMLQMALSQSAGFDSYIVEGPPVFVQKTMGYIMAPMARLLGYKSYYKEFDQKQTAIAKQ